MSERNDLMARVDEFWNTVLKDRPRHQARRAISRLVELLVDQEVSESMENKTASRGAPGPLSAGSRNADKKELQ